MDTITCDTTDATVVLILGEESHLREVARRLAPCESDVDDLVQDTLLRAYDARSRFLPGTSVRAWTTTILHRLFLTGALRAKRRRLKTNTDAGSPLEAAPGRAATPTDDSAQDVASFSDRLDDQVKRALERIPEIYRTSFFLSVVRDLSCDEIAQQLRVPVGTVMSRVHRARERLRTELSRPRSQPFVHAARSVH